jgi:hypothetical protein
MVSPDDAPEGYGLVEIVGDVANVLRHPTPRHYNQIDLAAERYMLMALLRERKAGLPKP